MDKKIKVTVEAAAYVPLDSIDVSFQEEIKTLSKEEYEKLSQSLIEEGIGLSLHIWKHKKKNYSIDGKQRVWTLRKMRDEEDFIIPEIPVSPIKAKTFQEAKRRVIIALSVSGKIKEDAFAKYILNNKIPIEFLAAHASPPGIDMGDFAEKFMNIKPPPLPVSGEGDAEKMASSSDQVKQVQLFFNAGDMEEFLNLTNELGEIYQIENISDTVLRAIRAAHQSET